MASSTRAIRTTRRTAWATALAVGLTVLAAVVATATNVGILGFDGPGHPVGQVSAAEPLAPSTTGVVVRYQDVYVTDPVASVTPAVAVAAVSPGETGSVGERDEAPVRTTVGERARRERTEHDGDGGDGDDD